MTNLALLYSEFILITLFVQATSVKTPEKMEEEDTMPSYDAETQALIDGTKDSLFYIFAK